MRFLTVNPGTMTGKSREVANMLKRRRVSIACVQETKWKGAKAKEIGEGYKMYYFGTSNNRNGVPDVFRFAQAYNLGIVNTLIHKQEV